MLWHEYVYDPMASLPLDLNGDKDFVAIMADGLCSFRLVHLDPTMLIQGRVLKGLLWIRLHLLRGDWRLRPPRFYCYK